MASPLVYYQLATSDPERTRAFLGELFEWPSAEEVDGAYAVQPDGRPTLTSPDRSHPSGRADSRSRSTSVS